MALWKDENLDKRVEMSARSKGVLRGDSDGGQHGVSKRDRIELLVREIEMDREVLQGNVIKKVDRSNVFGTIDRRSVHCVRAKNRARPVCKGNTRRWTKAVMFSICERASLDEVHEMVKADDDDVCADLDDVCITVRGTTMNAVQPIQDQIGAQLDHTKSALQNRCGTTPKKQSAWGYDEETSGRPRKDGDLESHRESDPVRT